MAEMQFGDQDTRKMREFLLRLFNNPNLSTLYEAEVEGFLIDFFKQSEQQLAGTFAAPAYYPHLEWRDVQILYFSVLKSITLEKLTPRVNALFGTKLGFDFLRSYHKDNSVAVESITRCFMDFVDTLLQSREVRQEMSAVIKLLEFDYVDRYVEQIFTRRGRIYNMLIRQDSLFHLKPIEVAHYIKATLMLHPALHLRIPIALDGAQGKTARLNLADLEGKKALQRQYEEEIENMLKSEFPRFPEPMIRAAIDSNKDCNEETALLSAFALFLSVLAKRGKDYAPWITVDKGAEKPDRSWFRVALKNFQYHGLDKGMLEELYLIASDEDW